LCAFDGESHDPGCPSGFYEYDRVPFSVPFKVDPNIKQPRVDEWTAGFERAITQNIRLSATGICARTRTSSTPSTRRALGARHALDPDGPLEGQPLGLYSWTNRTDSWENGYITNVNGFRYLGPDGQTVATANAYRRYKGLMLVLSKRFSNRWQAQASYVLSKTVGTLDNRGIGANAGFSHQWETPSLAVVNADGVSSYDMRHEVKLFATYQIPKIELGVNAYYRYFSGYPYAPIVTSRATTERPWVSHSCPLPGAGPGRAPRIRLLRQP